MDTHSFLHLNWLDELMDNNTTKMMFYNYVAKRVLNKEEFNFSKKPK
jgi:hypothetical protein